MTIPRFLLAIIILYLLVFRLNVSEVGMFFSAKYGGAPWSWDKFVDLLAHIWIPIVVIGTSGTVTTLAGLHLGLERVDPLDDECTPAGRADVAVWIEPG